MTSFRNHIRQFALALIAVLLMAFSVLIFWGFDRLLRQYVDSRLLAVADTWAGIVRANPSFLTQPGQEIEAQVHRPVPEEENRELREAALSILVLSPAGSVLWKGPTAVDRPAVDHKVLEDVRTGRTVFDTVRTGDAAPVRRVSLPIYRDGTLKFILQAETSLRLMQEARNGLIALLALGSTVITGLAWFGSGWLARKALTPLAVLSETAKRISEPSPGARLVLDAPYEEFRRLAGAFNAMMDRLQKLFESQRQFAADAAHELQTPLTVLKGNLEVAFRQARTAAEYREVLLDNLQEVERLIAVSRSLVTLAQFAGSNPPIRLQPMLIGPMLENLVADLMVLAEDRQIRMELIEPPVPPVLADEGQLKRVFINLLDNAIRYTAPGGAVTIRLGHEGTEAVIAVEDTGSGIEPEHLPHIFERFYRTDQARARETGGSGLGLAIVKEIVEAHRGSIGVTSQIGKGSVFTIRLPLSPAWSKAAG